MDDIPHDCERLTKILHIIEKGQRITMEISCFHSGEAFLDALANENFDIVFMDIFMDGMTGAEAAKQLRLKDSLCLLIFLTTSTEHMAEAFSRHAFDYIPKPVSIERVARAITDALKILTEEPKYMEFICARKQVRMLYSDFVSAVSDDHYLVITASDGERYKIRQMFSEFIRPIGNDSRFLQINKGIVVNMDHISRLENNDCVLKNGQKLPIKVRNRSEIEQSYQQYAFGQIRTC